ITAIGLMAAGIRAQTQPPWSSSYKIAFDHNRGGESELGVRELEALGASFPRDAVLATSIGAALDCDSRHQQAAQWYEKALAIDPQYEPALNNLALSLASRGLLEDAVPLLQRVLKINPKNGRAAYNLALIALRLKRFNEAVEAFQLARKVPEPAAPSETIALGEGTALFKLGRYAEAAKVLNSSSGCSEVASCLLLGSSQALSSDLPAAVSTFQSAVRLAPDRVEAFQLARKVPEPAAPSETIALGEGTALFKLGRYAEAAKVLNSSSGCSEVASCLLLGSSQALSSDLPAAVSTFQSAVRLA